MSSYPPGRTALAAVTQEEARPPGRAPKPVHQWWKGTGFIHGIVVGASAMAFLIGIIALVSWIATPRVEMPNVQPSPTSAGQIQSELDGSKPIVSAAPSLHVDSQASEAVDAMKLLAAVSAPRADNGAPYDRDLFGQAWADVDRNGCDTRNDILRRDLIDIVVKAGTNGCKVLRGELEDPYTGVAIDFVSGQNTSVLVQIDHVVPLAWAWSNGANSWSDDARVLFANDPANLLAVSGDENQAKSASGPSQWLPPNVAFACEYSLRFVDVLATYSLSVPADDRDSLFRVLKEC